METFTEPPWNTDDEPPIVSFCHRYLDRPGRFFLPDLFHIYLAGFGQDFAGSCLVYMLPVTFKSPLGDGVEAQLDTLNRSFKLWRKMFKVYTHTGSFNRNLLGFPDATKVFPTGTWSKASDTSKIITFIQYIAELFLTMVLRVTRFYTTFMWLALPLECAWKHSTKQIYGSILGFQPYFKIWVWLFPWADSRLHLQMFITYNSTWLSLVTPNRDLCALRHRSSFAVSSSVKQRATWNHCIDVFVTVLFIFEIFDLMITWGCGEITTWNADITPPQPWFNVYVR